MKNKLQALIGAIKNLYTIIQSKLRLLTCWQPFWEGRRNIQNETYGDWYNNHSWFEKDYFLHKLKRKIMGFIYRISNKINDLTCEKYYTRIIFHNQDDTFRAELPLIIYCDNYDGGRYIIGEIVSELVKTYSFAIESICELKKLSDKELDIQKQRVIDEYTRLGYNAMGEITFIPMTRKNILLDNIKLVTTLEDNSLAGLSSCGSPQQINFRVVKSNHLLNGLYQNKIYQIYIKTVDCNIIPKTEVVSREHIDKLKKGMGLI